MRKKRKDSPAAAMKFTTNSKEFAESTQPYTSSIKKSRAFSIQSEGDVITQLKNFDMGISGRRTTSSSRKETTALADRETESPPACISPIVATPNSKAMQNLTGYDSIGRRKKSSKFTLAIDATLKNKKKKSKKRKPDWDF